MDQFRFVIYKAGKIVPVKKTHSMWEVCSFLERVKDPSQFVAVNTVTNWLFGYKPCKGLYRIKF